MGSVRPASRFQRWILPGLAFKALVIGGGYATGRELAEFFLPSGPWGGVAAMLLATVIWSAICMATFAFARAYSAYDYQAFFRALLGRFSFLFEIAYLLFATVILAVFGAAAGAMGEALLGAPRLLGTLALMAGIALFTTFGNTSVERLFKYVSVLLYGVYIAFVALCLSRFGDRIGSAFAAPGPAHGWVLGGVTYASYNVVGAVVILPVVRHLTSRRDAFIAGAAAGPLAMLPALLFFVCMTAFYPGIAQETLPSDFMLRQLQIPVFHWLFQLMIFAALLESGTAAVHAFNERVANAWKRRTQLPTSRPVRLLVAMALLIVCMVVAERIGLVTLIATGYRALAYLILAVYVAPLLLFGVVRLRRSGQPTAVT
jgi:uncharacterized membrane protein YkvI